MRSRQSWGRLPLTAASVRTRAHRNNGHRSEPDGSSSNCVTCECLAVIWWRCDDGRITDGPHPTGRRSRRRRRPFAGIGWGILTVLTVGQICIWLHIPGVARAPIALGLGALMLIFVTLGWDRD